MKGRLFGRSVSLRAVVPEPKFYTSIHQLSQCSILTRKEE